MRVATEIIGVLDDGRCEGNKFFLPSYLDRATYVKTDTVLKAAGGKWDKKAKAHLFDEPCESRIKDIIVTGEIVVPQDFGYYPSPKAVVDRLVELAELHPRHKVLEPSAGRGAIAKGVSRIARNVWCCELLKDNCDALNESRNRGEWGLADSIVSNLDFLTTTASPVKLGKFDRVVMNPPFEKQHDILHVLHALTFLRPTGVLVSVMSASVTFRENKTTTSFYETVKAMGGKLTIEKLPENSFRESGTGVNTVIVKIELGLGG